MSTQTIVKAGLLISLLAPASVTAQTSGRPDGMRFVPDVMNQYRDLTERPDALGFHLGESPDPSSCRHYQAIVRVDAADGTPFFLLTRSGNRPDEVPIEAVCSLENTSPGETGNGHLIVVRMGSRPKHGERMRSNRLRKGDHVDDTPPPPEDKAWTYFTVVGGNPGDPDPAKRPGLVLRDGDGTPPQRVYQHPGGMQLVGNMLAVAVETPADPTLPRSQIMFFDVTDPTAPVFKSQYTPGNGIGQVLHGAGVLGVTPIPGGRYLMMVTYGQNTTWYFYRSRLTNPESTDLSSPNLNWEYVGSRPGPGVDDPEDHTLPGVTNPHQTLQFLRQGDINGPLYLAGARGRMLSDNDRLDLYRVLCATPYCVPGGHISVRVVYTGRRITPRPTTGGEQQLASLAAATGFHVTPSGELLFYATEHDNDGPDGTVKAGEWRHINMVRWGSPTLLPSVLVTGPAEVNEGSSISLAGYARPPITRAWIQLFHEPNFGGVDFASRSVVVDYNDYALDDFDKFSLLEFKLFSDGSIFFHNDKARSWKWFAPVGCSIFAMDHHNGLLDEARTLVGTGSLQEDVDLKLVLNDYGTDDIDQELDAIEFLPGCDYYYNNFELHWDLDVDGIYEKKGILARFDASHIDGPAEFNVPAQAWNPHGGPTAETTARVTVRNVAPLLTQFGVSGSVGHQVNGGDLNGLVPLVLTNLPVTVDAAFSDPGVLDHQTATIQWGDGSVQPHTAFTTFNEAFGDATGAVSHTHRYTIAGLRTIVLSVQDDDGGVSSRVQTVSVITPAQVIEMALTRLDAIIANTSDANALQHLQQARQALGGSKNGRVPDGAIHMIRSGKNSAAIVLLNQSIASLQHAQAAGVEVRSLITVLEQARTSLPAR